MSTTCAVCGRTPNPGAGLNRVGGADVCDPCYLGDAPRRIIERGWHCSIRQWDRVVNDDGDRLYFTEASLSLPLITPVQLQCRRRAGIWRLLTMLLPRLKSGDALFDRHVYVKASNAPAIALGFVRDEGVQSILLDMLGEGSRISVRGGNIEVYSCRDEYVPEARFSSEICVLASHLVRLQH